jgi:pimeloyl-ACP methyl ester carboxylesterase
MKSWHEGNIETDELRLHYIRTGGEKPPVVLAHGFSMMACAGHRSPAHSKRNTTSSWLTRAAMDSRQHRSRVTA